VPADDPKLGTRDRLVPTLPLHCADHLHRREEVAMIARTPASNLVSVYDGTMCLGHVLYKPRVGFEAYDHNDKPIGLFASQREAANALTDAAANERSS
jgi:hypothetical protein